MALAEIPGLLCFGEVFIFMVGVISSIFIDMVLRERIYAMLDTADAESLICGFRRVLRGLCDGEVLLDSHMSLGLEGSGHCFAGQSLNRNA